MNISYKRKLTLSFILIFSLFTAGIVVFGQYRARRYKTEALEEKLAAYCDLVYSFTAGNTVSGANADSLLLFFPAHLRLTRIATDGSVLYDNLFPDPSRMENHADRPEVVAAVAAGKGSDIRTSVSNSQPYLYFAKHYGNGIVRAALPYDIEVRHLLKPDNVFLCFVVALFLLGLLLIHYAGGRFGDTIRRLRDFSVSVSGGVGDMVVPDFPNDELGEIGSRIVEGYSRLKKSEWRLAREREKLLQHIQISAEGICFFNSDGTVAFYNGLFMQYLNAITRESDMTGILSAEAFRPVNEYLASGSSDPYYEYAIRERGRDFLLRLNLFGDGSFEIVLNDISEQEKTRKLKREITGNIAHELRTPVTSIRGYLETMLGTPLAPEQQRYFMEKAYNQTLALSELIRDMGLLTKIEESPGKFNFGEINLYSLVSEVATELREGLCNHRIVFHNKLPVDMNLRGNKSLLHSVFRNLTDNVIKYAGRNIEIVVAGRADKDGNLQISFADTGRGISDEKHLSRIFERFYRVDEGRTRGDGGSGLGLSIVKNAIHLHGGSIAAGNREGGGLELLITFPVPIGTTGTVPVVPPAPP